MEGRVEEKPGTAPENDEPLLAPETAADLRPIVAAVAALALAYYVALTRLVRGDLLNSYPFVSDDGFDWLVEGFAVARWLAGVPIPPFPAARSPVFVGVTFADFQTGANGYFLFAVIAAAVFASLAVLVLLGSWAKVPRYQTAVIVFVFAVSPLGFFRMWILSDQLAAAAMVVSAVALYPYLTRGSRGWLTVAAITAALGGATQLYGLVGFLVVGGWCLAVSVWRRRPDYLLGGALVAVPLGTFVLVQIWLGRVPHTGVPPQLSLIEFNLNMLDFYADVWSFVFIPLVPLLVMLGVYRRREVIGSPVLTGYWLTVLALMGTTFFYQFEDARFTVPTSLMLGVAIMATLPGARPLPRARQLMAATVALALLVGIILAPASYWKPQWSEMELNPLDTHVVQLLTAEPVDRFSLAAHCESTRLCAGAPLPTRISEHDRALLRIYSFLATADSSTSLEAFYEELYEGFVEQRNTNDCCLAETAFAHGLPGDRAVTGDWDGLPALPSAGTDTPGVFRNGSWALQNTNAEAPPDLVFDFGATGDTPVVGDWDGDGIDTIGIFRDGTWLLRNSNSEGPADLELHFGEASDIPVVGDWDGDGTNTVGVYRRGKWLLRNSNTSGQADIVLDFGGEFDRPVAGDWDGDGLDTIGTFTEGLWRLRNTNSDGAPDLDFYFGAFGHFPITGNWDGRGNDTIGISR